MVTQKEIETKWGLHKLLITGLKSQKLLAFKLGQFNIYLQTYKPLGFRVREHDTVVPYGTPYLAVVRTPFKGNVIRFIWEMKEFQALRIFKTATRMHKIEKMNGFACECITNALGLKSGKTFYISSMDKEMRDLFYRHALHINDEHNFGCKFDFDDYDYKFEIRKYIRPDGRISLVTIMSGEDMPNDWRTSDIDPWKSLLIKPQGTRGPWKGGIIK